MPPSLLNNLVHFESIIVFGIDTSEIELKMRSEHLCTIAFVIWHPNMLGRIEDSLNGNSTVIALITP